MTDRIILALILFIGVPVFFPVFRRLGIWWMDLIEDAWLMLRGKL